jgi:hypothetical protein
MEIAGLLELLFQGSCCLLEILALSADAGAGVAGVRAKRRINQRRASGDGGGPTQSPAAAIAVFIALTVIGVVLTAFAIAKWVH